MTRNWVRLVAALLTITVLSGCGLGGFHGLYNVSLPGGANLGAHPYTVVAQFRDALDLVPQSAVKVNNVPVGRVTKIDLARGGKYANVSLEVNGGVHLPANATASIEQTSLLGEKYVMLAAPKTAAAVGRLGAGATIRLASTAQGIELEQVFGALSLLLNGGGIGQLQNITTELNKAAGGREADVRSFLENADRVVAQLNAHRASITTALDQLARLSATLNAHRPEIANVLATLSPGLRQLAQQRTQLVGMLTALNKLSTVTVHTLNASQADIVDDFKQLAPILTNLADSGSALPKSLQVLLTYPFPDAVLGAIKGDYLNAFVTTNLNTPGGTVIPVRQSAAKQSAAARSSKTTASVPPTLLPATSSATPGLAASVINSGGQ